MEEIKRLIGQLRAEAAHPMGGMRAADKTVLAVLECLHARLAD